jgi:hypothetical protein
MKKQMDERDQQRQAIDAETEGTGRLRAGVDAARDGLERTRDGVEDAAWLARERLLWPAEDRLGRLADAAGREKGLGGLGAKAGELGGRVGGLDRRARIGVFGGGAVALGAIVAAVIVATSGGSGSAPATTEALVVKQAPAPVVKEAPAATPKPKKVAPSKPTGPTLHGAAPDFSPAKDVKAGIGGGEAVGGDGTKAAAPTTGDAPARRGTAANGPDAASDSATANSATGSDNPTASASAATAGAGDAAASTARIGATPEASASANEEAQTLEAAKSGVGLAERGDEGSGVLGAVAPKAAKQTARRFAEAFVVYEVGGVDGSVRSRFRHTSTKQLSRALLRRPPRQPAAVKVPQAKVVNVVAGPSRNGVYPVSVSLLRVGVTSELRLELEQGVGKKWQVTNVLG